MARRKAGPTNSRTVTLESGGTITFSYDFDLFDLSADDRQFVNGLIDTLREYHTAKAAKAKKSEPAPAKDTKQSRPKT